MRFWSVAVISLFLTVWLPGNVLAQPKITSFSPIAGKPGDLITLAGSNFNPTTTNNVVFFGATRATVTTATANSVTVTVPVGATYAPITLLNKGTNRIAYSRSNFTPTFSPFKTTITTTDFLPRQDFSLGSYYGPEQVVIGDLDGDGKPDLVVPNSGKNFISIFRNTSSTGSLDASSFAAKQDFATGLGPNSVAIGDLDGDGRLDLAVANGANTVSIFHNTSSAGSINEGSFAAKVDFATGNVPNSVAIGDLDGDGKPDLAVTNANSNSVSVFHNTSSVGSIGAGSFAVRRNFATGTRPYSIAIGDLDGDGKPEMAVANLIYPSSVSVFRNTSIKDSIGPGSFAAKQDFETGLGAYSVAIGDLDGDGKPDLAVTNHGGGSVSVLRNTSTSDSIGPGSFAAKVDFPSRGGPVSVAIGDLNGDGKPDLAVANDGYNSGDKVSIFRNTATNGSIDAGSFTLRQDFASSQGFVHSLAIGDLDGDGKPDLAIPHFNGSSVSVLRNADIVYTFTGSGNWNNSSNWEGNQVPPSIVPNYINILINPTGSGECILNVPVTVPKSSSITVAKGKKFIVQGNLTISNQ